MRTPYFPQVSAASAISLWLYPAINAAIAAFLAGERHALEGLLASYVVKAGAVVFERLTVFPERGGGSLVPQAVAPARSTLSALHRLCHIAPPPYNPLPVDFLTARGASTQKIAIWASGAGRRSGLVSGRERAQALWTALPVVTALFLVILRRRVGRYT